MTALIFGKALHYVWAAVERERVTLEQLGWNGYCQYAFWWVAAPRRNQPP